ncbi:MAG: primosomal protein N' [Phycisphaerae bacterium]|nr:primosomal protein N' [Phycisphaerae bacterium]
MVRKQHQPYLPSLQPDPPETSERRVAAVATITPTDKIYSYAVPSELADLLGAGQRVEVPLGRQNRPTLGFCVGLSTEPWTSTLKPILRVVDDAPLLDASLIELARWISRYYCCPPGRAMAAMVPEPVRSKSGWRKIRRVRAAKPLAEIESEARRLGPKQRRLIEHLVAANEPVDANVLQNDIGCGCATIKTAAQRGWVVVETAHEPVCGPNFDRPIADPDFELTPDQRHAVEESRRAVDEERFQVLVLFGVAGSGKTEVYVRAIRDVVARGRQAIMLVPEIALTTQLVDRLARRFSNLAVIHSGLTGVQRSLVWSDIASGRKRVIIGTRSAVFAPAPDLGLIVVDEEQDGSYENLQSPRFHSRDVAIVRASQASIPVLLGSATPSLETWHNARRMSHYKVLSLPRRVAGLPMPRVHVVPMQAERHSRRGFHVLSQPMEYQLRETLAQGEQAVLLMNRRGYSSTIFCPRCGWMAVCPHCDVHLVFHQISGILRCHRCSHREKAPETCPDTSCGGTPLRFGEGTQRVEEELLRKFPEARVARADSDTMLRGEQYEELIRRFESGELNVLVGTQMIAKGLDFPLVSFVGVINADTTMMVSDFRASERTFQLITQVAGRAGRARGQGIVIVQTDTPDLPPIRLAVKHDYEAFATQELELRAKLKLPPVYRLTRIVLSDPNDSKVQTEAKKLAEAVREAAEAMGAKLACNGPERCPVQRERQHYRWELLLRAQSAEDMQRVLDRIRGKTLQGVRAKRLVVDVDPISLM